MEVIVMQPMLVRPSNFAYATIALGGAALLLLGHCRKQYSKLFFLVIALLPARLPIANWAASCGQWTIEWYTGAPVVGPYNESLYEYYVLFSRSGVYAAATILTSATLTPQHLATFAPQEECVS
jgi:hypothetical protein